VLGVLTGSEHDIRTLDGRRLSVRLPPFTLAQTVVKEGMPFRETDAVGQRVVRRGDLVVYLYVNWSEARGSIASWARTLMYIGGVYLFLTNTSAFMMLFMLYSFLRGR